MKLFNPRSLDGYAEVFATYPYERRRAWWARLRCRLNGHMWMLVTYSPQRHLAKVECFRCWPHRDSIRILTTYHPYPTYQPPELA